MLEGKEVIVNGGAVSFGFRWVFCVGQYVFVHKKDYSWGA